LRNFEKNAKKITKAVERFIEKEFRPLREKDKITKVGEFLVGYQETKKVKGNLFIILQLPEGVEAAIDLQGKLYDLNEIQF